MSNTIRDTFSANLANNPDDAAPSGLVNSFGFISTKMPRLRRCGSAPRTFDSMTVPPGKYFMLGRLTGQQFRLTFLGEHGRPACS